MINVLIVDDHVYIRKGLSSLLEAIPDIEVIDTAANGIEAVAKAQALRPDVMIIDISMPLMNGIEATQQIHAACPDTHILALSINPDGEYVRSALDAGAQGYVLKDKMGDELIEAIRSVYEGKRYFSQRIADVINPYREENIDSWAG